MELQNRPSDLSDLVGRGHYISDHRMSVPFRISHPGSKSSAWPRDSVRTGGLVQEIDESSPEGSGQSSPDTKSTHYRKKSHSPDVWEAHKGEIARLYLEENKRLKDVMEMMEKNWGFQASQKMYKTKLTQWKLFKNNRQADVANILYLQRHRLAIGKESTFRRNGKTIDVEAYIRRKGIKATDLVEAAESGDLPSNLRCRTPPSIPKGIGLPDDLFLKEKVFQWASQAFIKPRSASSGYIKQLDSHHESEAMRSVELLTHGCWLFSTGHFREGGGFCRRAFALAHHLLDESAYLSIFELMLSISRYPNAEIVKELWSYLSRYSAMLQGVNQPLYRMLSVFASYSREHGFEHNVAILDWALQWASSRFQGSIDGKPFDYAMLRPWDLIPLDGSYHRYYLFMNRWEVASIPSAAIPTLNEVEDASGLRADLLLIFGNQTKWRDERILPVALKVLEQVRVSPQPSEYLEFVCLYVTARYNRARSEGRDPASGLDHKLAREYLQLAADLQGRAWAAGKNYYETLTLLEGWHREAGDQEAARSTQKKRDESCTAAMIVLYK